MRQYQTRVKKLTLISFIRRYGMRVASTKAHTMELKTFFRLKWFNKRSHKPVAEQTSAICKRLAAEAELLEGIERDRVRFNCPEFGRTVEESIIWRELVDLELQEVDEHLSSIDAR